MAIWANPATKAAATAATAAAAAAQTRKHRLQQLDGERARAREINGSTSAAIRLLATVDFELLKLWPSIELIIFNIYTSQLRFFSPTGVAKF